MKNPEKSARDYLATIESHNRSYSAGVLDGYIAGFESRQPEVDKLQECCGRFDGANDVCELEKIGTEPGEVCNRNGCKGIIEDNREGGCSCHLNPPCSYCTEQNYECSDCDWNETDENSK